VSAAPGIHVIIYVLIAQIRVESMGTGVVVTKDTVIEGVRYIQGFLVASEACSILTNTGQLGNFLHKERSLLQL
jgi:phage-related holin